MSPPTAFLTAMSWREKTTAWLAGALTFCLALVAASPAAAQFEPLTKKYELFGGLVRGMTAQEAAIAVIELYGVKRAEVKHDNKLNRDYVDVSHYAEGGHFDGVSAYPNLVFDEYGLSQVTMTFAAGKNTYRELIPTCESRGAAAFNSLSQDFSKHFDVTGSEINEITPLLLADIGVKRADDLLRAQLNGSRNGSRNASYLPFVANAFSDQSRSMILTANFGIQPLFCDREDGIAVTPKLVFMLSPEAEGAFRASRATPARSN